MIQRATSGDHINNYRQVNKHITSHTRPNQAAEDCSPPPPQLNKFSRSYQAPHDSGQPPLFRAVSADDIRKIRSTSDTKVDPSSNRKGLQKSNPSQERQPAATANATHI